MERSLRLLSRYAALVPDKDYGMIHQAQSAKRLAKEVLMNNTALKEKVVFGEKRTVRISSKRQITIPSKVYSEMNFNEYALCTVTDQGLLIQPFNVDDEDISVGILRELVSQGFDGEDLIEQYKLVKRRFYSSMEKAAEIDRTLMQDARNRNISDDELFGC